MRHFLLVLCLFLVGCGSIPDESQAPQNNVKYIEGNSGRGYQIKMVEFRGCEYVATEVRGGWHATHAGNCKSCEEKRFSKIVIQDTPKGVEK